MTITRWRRLVQAGGLLFGLLGFAGIGMTHVIFPGLHCYACPLSVTVCPIGMIQNLIVFGTVPFYWLGAIAAYGLIAGRGFCGWFCPFGTLNDLLSFRKVKIWRTGSFGKYVILGGTLVAAWAFADTLFCKICPAATIEASIPYLFLGVATVNAPFLIHVASFAVTLIGMILIARFWCRYLCPMGALLSLFNRVSLLHLELRTDRCVECGACAVRCPMGIEPHVDHDDHNCIKCGACAEACTFSALRVRFSWPFRRKTKRS